MSAKMTRVYPARKNMLFNTHRSLLNSPVLLFLRPTDFTAVEFKKLRAQIPESSRLTFLRSGLFPALLRDPAVNIPSDILKSHEKGSLALITADNLHPPTLRELLKIVQTFSNTPSPNAPPPDPKAKAEKSERLSLLSSILDNQEFTTQGTASVSQLPELDVLRSQIVGLLSAPGSRIVGTLTAPASSLQRTLAGLKAGLEASQASA